MTSSGSDFEYSLLSPFLNSNLINKKKYEKLYKKLKINNKFGFQSFFSFISPLLSALIIGFSLKILAGHAWVVFHRLLYVDVLLSLCCSGDQDSPGRI